jgi:hypothetical protein
MEGIFEIDSKESPDLVKGRRDDNEVNFNTEQNADLSVDLQRLLFNVKTHIYF